MLTAPTNPVDTDNFPAPLATHASLFQNGRKNILGGECRSRTHGNKLRVDGAARGDMLVLYLKGRAAERRCNGCCGGAAGRTGEPCCSGSPEESGGRGEEPSHGGRVGLGGELAPISSARGGARRLTAYLLRILFRLAGIAVCH
jgi:hypothetical protein